MKKYITSALCLLAVSVFAIDNVDRHPGQTLNQGGTTTLNGSTVVESNSPTNAFKQIVVVATVSGAQTAATNNFSPVYIATPTAIRGLISGQAATVGNASTITITTSNLVVTGLSTNLATGTNAFPIIVYGYTRTGRFE